MIILELKNGNVNINDIQKYNELKNELERYRKKLSCVTSDAFRFQNYFVIGHDNYDDYENKDYIVVRGKDYKIDNKFKTDLLEFITGKLIEVMNEIISEMNDLIKE